MKNTIICSTIDRASQNIKNNLLSLRKWEHICSKNEYSIFEFKNFRIVEINSSLIYQDEIDKKLKDLGFPAGLIIFISKHRSKDGRAIFTVHFTGNSGEAKFGGKTKKLSTPAPQALRSLIHSLKLLSENENYEVTLECTHHGPSEIDTPSVFIEIGSNENEWLDEVAGKIVANSILLLKEGNYPVAVGFGGTHYAPRQTSLIFETGITFGHIFPTHAISELDEDLIRQAFVKSGADFAYIDRKSMNASQRDELIKTIEKIGYEVLKESDIRDMDGIPWQFCTQLRKKVNEVCPSGRAKLTQGIKSACQNCCPKMKIARINPSLLSEAEKLDKKRLENFLLSHDIAYVEHDNGSFSNVIIAVDDNCARLVVEELTEECIEILKKHYEINISNGNLQIIEKKFSPKLASSYGISEGPLYGKLTKGESINIDGKTINPEMVYETSKRVIKLK